MRTKRRNQTRPVLRHLVFGLITATLSLLLFVVVAEGGLRLIGYGHPTRYYRTEVDAAHNEWFRENRWVTAPYFSPELVRRPPAMRIPTNKAPDTYRVFVLGSSAAMGDPELSFSFARVLEQMLGNAYPDLQFEVVNAAITAVNSHVVRGIAADCADLDPDLFIVYEGHNEVIGPFGPGTVFTPFIESPRMIRMLIALRQSRSGQLIASLARKASGGDDRPEEWGGMQMFLDEAITADDSRLESVRRSFEANLHSIVDSGASAGANTILCTVLTNRRDFSPFLPAEGSPEDSEWGNLVGAGDTALAKGDFPAAIEAYGRALAIDPSDAGVWFRLGRAQLAMDDAPNASRSLQNALDLDTLRFRTSSELNAAVRTVAAEQPRSSVLVDVDRLASAESPYGIPGDELLYEHVHLTLLGAFRVADALFPEVSADLLARGLIPEVEPQTLDYRQVRERLGYTPYEQGMIAQMLLQRFSAAPFTGKSDNDARLAAWRERSAAIERLLAMPGSDVALVNLYEQAVAANPADWILARNYGMALLALDRPDEALTQLERTYAVINDDPDTLFSLALANSRLGNESQAAALLNRLRELEPRYPGLSAPELRPGSAVSPE